MKEGLILLFFAGLILAFPEKAKFEDASQVKKVILTCDEDKNGELSSDEFAKCVSKQKSRSDLAK